MSLVSVPQSMSLLYSAVLSWGYMCAKSRFNIHIVCSLWNILCDVKDILHADKNERLDEYMHVCVPFEVAICAI